MTTLRRLTLFSAIAVVLCSCAGRSAKQVSVLPDVQKIGNLEGNYSMKFTMAGETRYATAAVKKTGDREYQIARVTVYGPTVYTFRLGEDGTVSSEELGTGSITYRSDLKLTTIRFEKPDFQCELTR
ncbi:MAG: hypothetical protein II874_10265 [Bacteroidales bacterium]|nr:hypothetical protein [Bacteroidales bacterium]